MLEIDLSILTQFDSRDYSSQKKISTLIFKTTNKLLSIRKSNNLCSSQRIKLQPPFYAHKTNL